MRLSALPLAAALFLALSAGAIAQSSGGSRDAEALAALRAIIADPATPVAPVLSEYDFGASQYLVDGLTRNEMFRLQAVAREYGVDLPSGILTALRVKANRSRPNRG